MRCDFCNSDEANINLIKIIDNRIEKINVCSKCIKKLTLSSGDEFIEDVADMLSKIFEVDLTSNDDIDKRFFELVEDIDNIDGKKCKFCGMSLSAVKKKGQMGCSRCYESFEEELLPLLEAIHGSINYRGKVPDYADTSLKIQRKIQRLRYRLEEEVFIENFEEAARIRDAISKLKEKLKKDKRVKRK